VCPQVLEGEKRHEIVEGSCKCTELTLADSQQGVVLQGSKECKHKGRGRNNSSLSKVSMLVTIYFTQGVRLGHTRTLSVASKEAGLEINADKINYA
jgi:hypothetical protein